MASKGENDAESRQPHSSGAAGRKRGRPKNIEPTVELRVFVSVTIARYLQDLANQSLFGNVENGRCRASHSRRCREGTTRGWVPAAPAKSAQVEGLNKWSDPCYKPRDGPGGETCTLMSD